MNLTEEDMKAIVSEATANLKAQLTANLTTKLDSDVTWAASQAVREHVQEWVKTNVLPDVTAILIAGKASLVNTAANAAEMMCDDLAKSMADTLKERLGKSWERKKIFDAMFIS